MATKDDLKQWVAEALRDLGGSARLIDVAERIWMRHEGELKSSGDLFFRWQYDMRWAANELRRSGVMKPVDELPRGYWGLK
ncbi:hypothetical protein [Hyphobacterium indicum]|uniref:hypothetical protein n=1 Tax=Hyphobacterium indicum TaxID=2162714 RepID=UPI000D6523F1|nr:hypothetical protein [Hyphobacterium indicum]